MEEGAIWAIKLIHYAFALTLFFLAMSLKTKISKLPFNMEKDRGGTGEYHLAFPCQTKGEKNL